MQFHDDRPDFDAAAESLSAVFAADPETGGDLARVDWAGTPLGEPAGWPQSLQTAVSILLSSRFSMWMAWGPQLTFFCNAAYRRDTLSRKYPWALGRPANEVWAEIWDDIGPRIDTVLSTARATWDERLLLFLERSGYVEESYHTFSYSPLRDDSGAVVGMLCVVREDTEQVVGDRRMATLRDLGSDPSVVRTEQEMLAFTGRQLERNQRDLPFTVTYLFDDDGSAQLAGTSGVAVGHPVAPAGLGADDADAVWPTQAVRRGEAALVALDSDRLVDPPTGDWPDPPTQALLVPLLRQGSAPYGFLVIGLNRYRLLDDAYSGFVELVAAHVAAGIASARSYQAQQRRAEELAELDRAKTTFFSNISHEFRTPLTLILGPLHELRSSMVDTSGQVGEDLDMVHRNALRLSKLVNTLLDFSRIEAGRMEASYVPVDLSAVTAELSSVFRSAIERAGLRFAVDCPPLDQPVYVDRGMWEKVILNLLSNALKFTFEGSITVTVRATDSQALVMVADTGIGVAAKEMPRLFERFHRIDNARARSNEGSGIGLALVQELVGLHGGTITAASTEGEGTTFTIGLPFGVGHVPAEAIADVANPVTAVAAADPYVQEALRWLPAPPAVRDDIAVASPLLAAGIDSPAVSASVVGDRTSARVLVADDNADMRDYLTRILSGAGHQVSVVDDGQQALEVVRARLPDLVVSDVMMPGLDGLTLLAALREDPRTAAVPVLLLSARAGAEAAIEGLQAGADDYLTKPFAAAELLARVRANVDMARLRNHHARWRTALVDSLQEAFFVCDEYGTVIEINTAFTTILGYGPEDLAYEPIHPWWPDAATDPEAHQQVVRAFGELLGQDSGNYTVPLTHRNGHRVWVNAAFNRVDEPDTGRRVIVGTFRDVTVEHYAIQRESARAALSTRLSQAVSLSDALEGALSELQRLWRARAVLAAVFGRGDEPDLTSTDDLARWSELPASLRGVLADLRHQPPLTPITDEGGAGIVVDHPDGSLVLWIDLDEHRQFTSEDQVLLSLLAGHLAQGVARAHQIDQQRETAIALQRAILGPANLPDGFAVRYEPATRPLEVGGDWYDTIALSDDRIGIVVGDCVGRGLQAAAVMGQLRSACRALLLQDHSPARTLMALDQFAATIPGAACTTAFCGVLDPATGQLTYASAGHPPSILAQSDGTTHVLEDGRSMPLAVRANLTRPEAQITIPGRATLLLYTDGLVERRGRPLTIGIDQAGDAVQEGRNLPVDDLASAVMTRLKPAGGYDDDVALLLYRQPGPLEITFPAHALELAPVRSALRTWLSRCNLSVRTIQDILVAAGEACANAVEHANRETPGQPIHLRARAFVDAVHVTIVDNGRWKPARTEPSKHRGRGLALMRSMMDEVNITHGSNGTTVELLARIPS